MNDIIKELNNKFKLCQKNFITMYELYINNYKNNKDDKLINNLKEMWSSNEYIKNGIDYYYKMKNYHTYISDALYNTDEYKNYLKSTMDFRCCYMMFNYKRKKFSI